MPCCGAGCGRTYLKRNKIRSVTPCTLSPQMPTPTTGVGSGYPHWARTFLSWSPLTLSMDTNVTTERFRNLASNLLFAVGLMFSSTTCGRPLDSRMVQPERSSICCGDHSLEWRRHRCFFPLCAFGFITSAAIGSSESGRFCLR